MKRFFIIATIACTILTSCNKDTDVTGITLNKTSLTIEKGKSETLTATIAPNDATNQNVTWKASDGTIASVDATGKITGLKAGNTTITATTEDGSYTATCKVEITIRSIVINGVTWAECNIAAPKTFVTNAEDVGMLYQWGRITGWSTTDPLISSPAGVAWDNTYYAGRIWEKENDPSPEGWHIPTEEEIKKLFDQEKVTYELATQNNVEGYKFTDKSTDEFIFLPAMNLRWQGSGLFTPNYLLCSYWSSTIPSMSVNGAGTLDVDYRIGPLFVTIDRAIAVTIRCVKD